MKVIRILRACSVAFALLAITRSAVAQLPSGGLTPDSWQGEADYFARFAVIAALPFVERVGMFQLLLPDDRRRTRVDEPRRSDDDKRSEGPKRTEEPKRSEEPRRSEEPKRSEVVERPGMFQPLVERPGMFQPHVTPEPSTWLLLGTGLVGVFGLVLIRSART